MKKILLIPTLLATTVAPLSCLASLTSCGEQKRDYLTFEALEDGQLSCDVKVYNGSPIINLHVQYSLNNGEWTKLEVNIGGQTSNSLTYKVGDNIRLKGINDYWSFMGEIDDKNYTFDSSLHFTGLVNASGNIMSLLYGDDFTDKTAIPCDGCFQNIFNGKVSEELKFTQIKDAQNLILPATTLTLNCYAGMFNDCVNLVNAPALPATTLDGDYCYDSMFKDCGALESAPELPATTLAYACYESMFENCASLVTAPQLPATTLVPSCYRSMFYDCDALTNAPALPATTLDDYCYESMFKDCGALESAPKLPATTLANECYGQMFRDCDALKSAPELPAEILATNCYRSMFEKCTSLIVKINYGDADKLIFECPDGDDMYIDLCTHFMFSGTKGDTIDIIKPNTSYYWAEQ